MSVICKAPHHVICVHKRNPSPDFITCAIEASTQKCKFAQSAGDFIAQIQKTTEVKPSDIT